MTVSVPDFEDFELEGLPKGMELWYGGPIKGGIEEVDENRRKVIRALFRHPDTFLHTCYIQTMDSSVALMKPTTAQKKLAYTYQANRWTKCSKYRQAKISTVACALFLRDIMYGKGLKGAVIAQDRDQCDEMMDRILFILNNMPEEVRNPYKKGSIPNRSRIEFADGSVIVAWTAKGEGIGVGKSPDRLLITEACEMDDETLKMLEEKAFPALTRRPNARVIWESTPGKHGGRQYRSWKRALAGETYFTALFLKWWEDDSCMLRDHDTGELVELGELTDEEMELMERLEGCTRHHIFFRRVELRNTFDDDEKAFENKYPSGPLSGWSSDSTSVFDGNASNKLQDMLSEARYNDLQLNNESRLWEFVPPDPTRFYLICVDPANFGSQGDFSGISVFDTHSWEEVASWEGRASPSTMKDIVYAASDRYGQLGPDNKKNIVMVESNISALLGILVNDNRVNLYHQTHDSGRTEPGWRASAKSLQHAEGDMEAALISEDIKLNNPAGIQQLIAFDGKAREKRTKKGKNTSHYDLARTYVMAAFALTRHTWPRPLTDEELSVRLKRMESEAEDLERAAEKERNKRIAKTLKQRTPNTSRDVNPWAPGAGYAS